MPPFRSLRVLVAEDNPVNQRLVRAVLEDRGHTFVLAATGREALAAWEREPFDLILMDVHMPEMDGLAAAAAIRARDRSRVPIVALTASAEDGDDERCLAAGMDACVGKPIQAAELLELIERIASSREPAVPSPWEASGAATEPGGGEHRKLNGLFLADAARLGDEIRDAIARRDGAALQAAAHRLRGSAGYFAAPRAFELAARLEQLGRAGDFTAETERAWRELVEELARLDQALAAGSP
ncbi:MAG TPA: response regulator [Thermoanaerobaculia bacterium]|jgi:CheY-like chemotaxis protein|nr:response regulator [Thermoanaerobaculia bacterium]